MNRESASAHARRGHPCSCGRVLYGNGYGRHRKRCQGSWITWTAWEELRAARNPLVRPPEAKGKS